MAIYGNIENLDAVILGSISAEAIHIDGEDGVSPEVTITPITGGHRVSITDRDHPSGQDFDVMNGEDGTDGEDGRSVASATINAAGHLIITYDDGTSTDAGVAQGDVTKFVIWLDGSTMTSEQTIQQIFAAYNAGKLLELHYTLGLSTEERIITGASVFTSGAQAEVRFSGFDNDAAGGRYYTFSVGADNRWSVKTYSVNEFSAISSASTNGQIPTAKQVYDYVGRGTLTIKQGGETKGTFDANASADVEIELDEGGGASFDIHALTTENELADADEMPFYDASAQGQKKTAWSNIKAKLKGYFDTLYVGASAISDMATKTWVNAQGFITSLAGYATQAWVQSSYRTASAQDTIDSGKVSTSTTVNGHALSGNVSVTKSDVGLGNVANERQYSASNPPPDMATQTWVSGRGYITASDIPVVSVNGKTGTVVLTAADLGIGSVFDLKGSKPTKTALPSTGNDIGDVWYVIDESVGYIWLNDGTTNRWEMLGMSVDLSAYATKTELTTTLTSYVEKVAGKGLSTNDFTDAYKSKLDSAITSLNGYATEEYVDDGLDRKINKNTSAAQGSIPVFNLGGGLGASGKSFALNISPSADNNSVPTSAAVKTYVDAKAPLIVTATGNITGTITNPSHNYADIKAAYDAGREVELHLSSSDTSLPNVLKLTQISNSRAEFGYDCTGTSGSGKFALYAQIAWANGTWSNAYREVSPVTAAQIAAWDGKQDAITSTNKLSYSLLTDTPTIPTVPQVVSAFTNDAGYLTLNTLPKYNGGVS